MLILKNPNLTILGEVGFARTTLPLVSQLSLYMRSLAFSLDCQPLEGRVH